VCVIERLFQHRRNTSVIDQIADGSGLVRKVAEVPETDLYGFNKVRPRMSPWMSQWGVSWWSSHSAF